MTVAGVERGLMSALVAAARSHGAPDTGGVFSILSTRAGAVVVRLGDVVVKAHPVGTDPVTLRARLAVATALGALFVPPLGPLGAVEGRLVTVWPAGEPVSPDDPDLAPWEAAATLLARLHGVPPASVGAGELPAGPPARVVRAVHRARRAAPDTPELAILERAFEALPPTLPAAPRPPHAGPTSHGGAPTGPAPASHALASSAPVALVHGDWHLGQLVRRAGGVAHWRLIDVEDLGGGDPAWDLARPAALFAAGVLDPAAWHRFLDAYRAAGGCAVPPAGDAWPRLDAPAKALAVQLAASALADAAAAGRSIDDFEVALLDTCRRITADGGTADVS